MPAGWLALAGARRVRGRERLRPAVSSWTRQGEARAEGGRASRDPDGDVPSDTSEAWVWAPVGRAGPLWGRQPGLAGSPVGCLCTKTPPQTNLLEQSKCSENVSRMFVSFVIMGRGRGSHQRPAAGARRSGNAVFVGLPVQTASARSSPPQAVPSRGEGDGSSHWWPVLSFRGLLLFTVLNCRAVRERGTARLRWVNEELPRPLCGREQHV